MKLSMMKFITKWLFFIGFFLISCLCSFAQESINISSVILDNSINFISINSMDLSNYNLNSLNKLQKKSDENTVYFDIQDAVLNCSTQNFEILSSDISEINIFQLSREPDVVRIEISYNNNFKTNNIRVKKIGNSIIVQFKYPTIKNYYFQTIMQDLPIPPYFEKTKIQYKVPNKSEKSLLGQINSSFNSDTNNNDYILADKTLNLITKFYIDDIAFDDNIPIITGIGSYTVTKPIYLENPSRVAFDLPNSIVNPVIRNQEISFGNDEIIKIGQFDSTTARIVITSPKPGKFVPVIYPDNQRLVFLDTENVNPFSLYRLTTNLSLIKHEQTDDINHSIKFVFSAPVIFGIDKNKNKSDIYFYNINDFNESSIRAELKNTPFENTSISKTVDGSLKLSFNSANFKEIDFHMGTDGKTVRVKTKLSTPYNSREVTIEKPEIVIPSIPKKIKGKKYIMIDPGHGGSDVGATRNNIYEKDITLDIAKRVEKLLKNKGYIVEMTRYDDKTVSLQERVEMSELFNPDIFVSIHVNSSNSTTPSGLETHYYKDNSIYLAKCVHAALLNNINSNDRGLFKSKFYVINHTTAPAILVETGFISNPSERAQLITENRKNATAKAIAEGIDEYFKQK